MQNETLRAWRAAAEQLGLYLSTLEMAGTLFGGAAHVELRVMPTDAVTAGLEGYVEARDAEALALDIVPRSHALTDGVGTGDPTFDEVAVVQGLRAVVDKALSEEARARAMPLLARGCRVERGQLMIPAFATAAITEVEAAKSLLQEAAGLVHDLHANAREAEVSGDQLLETVETLIQRGDGNTLAALVPRIATRSGGIEELRGKLLAEKPAGMQPVVVALAEHLHAAETEKLVALSAALPDEPPDALFHVFLRGDNFRDSHRFAIVGLGAQSADPEALLLLKPFTEGLFARYKSDAQKAIRAISERISAAGPGTLSVSGEAGALSKSE